MNLTFQSHFELFRTKFLPYLTCLTHFLNTYSRSNSHIKPYLPNLHTPLTPLSLSLSLSLCVTSFFVFSHPVNNIQLNSTYPSRSINRSIDYPSKHRTEQQNRQQQHGHPPIHRLSTVREVNPTYLLPSHTHIHTQPTLPDSVARLFVQYHPTQPTNQPPYHVHSLVHKRGKETNHPTITHHGRQRR